MRRLVPLSRAWWEHYALASVTVLALLVFASTVVRSVGHFRHGPRGGGGTAQPITRQLPDRAVSIHIPEGVPPSALQWLRPTSPFGEPQPPPSGPRNVETPPNHMEDLP